MYGQGLYISRSHSQRNVILQTNIFRYIEKKGDSLHPNIQVHVCITIEFEKKGLEYFEFYSYRLAVSPN